ncbi:hypothetical protein E3N88_07401 [Mikania micrantha]|uniref:Uncharacterized protein n=1 Tax=Mikania micrantha TaxID=192012 RepID=A0A5N6PTJ9_9ASTR|nr:hypothetical protein E3N88_07401 [Mikania micrantha]
MVKIRILASGDEAGSRDKNFNFCMRFHKENLIHCTASPVAYRDEELIKLCVPRRNLENLRFFWSIAYREAFSTSSSRTATSPEVPYFEIFLCFAIPDNPKIVAKSWDLRVLHHCKFIWDI